MPEIGGEYWITDDGRTIFCDGDAGPEVPNHECVIMRAAWHKIIEGLEEHGNDDAKALISQCYHDEPVPDAIMVRTAINDSIDDFLADGLIDDDAADNIYAWLTKQAQVESVLFDLATDPYNFFIEGKYRDAREFAIGEWEWFRMAGQQVTIPRIDQAICARLDTGLRAIADNRDISEGDFNRMTWDIECVTPSIFKTGIPSVLLGDARMLRDLLFPTSLCNG